MIRFKECGRGFVRWIKVPISCLIAISCNPSNVEYTKEAVPNIVLIVSDDQGFHDIGCFGSTEVITPNLDRLASGGIKLTSFYVTWPACTPSRASLLSGRYPQRNGVYDMIRNEAPDFGYQYRPGEYEGSFERVGGMDIRERLLPQFLKDAGYISGIFGKWDLGIHKRYLPLAKGFDDFYGFTNTGIDYYTHERYGVPSMYRNNQPTHEDRGVYSTYLFQREAERFLDENHKRPFFLYIPFNAPHSASNLDPRVRGAAQAPTEFKELYPHLDDSFVTRKNPKYLYRESDSSSIINQYPSKSKRRLEYLASVTAMDVAIGEILDLLDQYEVADNTIVIFFSDNGGGGGSADNHPLKGYKAWLFEGGVRVPCIIRYPGKIPAGSSTNEFLTSLELVPTLLKTANISIPTDIVLDGFDMMPVLTGAMESSRTDMYWHRRNDKAARVGNWKWVESANGNGLFNLAVDIGETTDLSLEDPAKLDELKASFYGWKRQMDQAEPRGPFRDY